jgi:hypothetical protein
MVQAKNRGSETQESFGVRRMLLGKVFTVGKIVPRNTSTYHAFGIAVCEY